MEKIHDDSTIEKMLVEMTVRLARGRQHKEALLVLEMLAELRRRRTSSSSSSSRESDVSDYVRRTPGRDSV